MWSENENEIILRQIYLLEDFRCKGYGTLMVKEWVNNYIHGKFDKFGVQYPNNITYKILEKLKYISKNDEGNICYFVS